MKIKFYYDKEKDIENILNTLNSDIFKTKRGLIPKELVNACQNKSKDEARNELQRILNDFQDLILVKELVKVFSDAWKAIEVEYFNLLKIIFNKTLKEKEIKGFLTQSGMCPYNPDNNKPFFMVYIFQSIPSAMMNIAHEVMHVYFHWLYGDLEKELGEEKFNILKESITILLDLEFKDLLIVNDRGYDSHKELRELISRVWKTKKSFNDVLTESINYLKGDNS